LHVFRTNFVEAYRQLKEFYDFYNNEQLEIDVKNFLRDQQIMDHGNLSRSTHRTLAAYGKWL